MKGICLKKILSCVTKTMILIGKKGIHYDIYHAEIITTLIQQTHIERLVTVCAAKAVLTGVFRTIR